jgi:beta-lactamase class A
MMMPPFVRGVFTKKRIKLLMSYLLVGAVCGAVGWSMSGAFSGSTVIGGILRQSNDHYKLISPLLSCEIAAPQVFNDMVPLKTAIANTIEQQKKAKKALSVSVYYRSLRDAHYFALGDDELYEPASLLKVFVMMAYYSKADESDDPGFLQTRVPFQGSGDPSLNNPGEIIPHLIPQQLYTLDDIIKQMIVYSDNDALTTLLANLSPDMNTRLNQIFADLNIESPFKNDETTYTMTVSRYAAVMRLLYSSTYLSRSYSERALTLLSETHYKDALAAGVPQDVVVAHKFGIKTVPASEKTPPILELHDCGIVYYPNHDYLLCVMTKGGSGADLQNVIKEISTEAYAFTRNRYAGERGN